MQCIVPIAGQKWCHPNDYKHEFAVTKKRLAYAGDIKESKKYGGICTCCHIDNLPRCKCVIFLTKNYNVDIPTVANALDIEKLDRRNSYANHIINNWKMANAAAMSKIVIIMICSGQM